ncbi:hypothetical protein MMC10_000813 [Thelotrema lepadinum]|nr:hypothetical protein [Thelotrema lepadinum]
MAIDRSKFEHHNSLYDKIGVHNNVIQLLSSEYHSLKYEALYAISPFVFSTLTEVIKTYSINNDTAVSLMRGYADGLAHIHNHAQLIHADLSGKNLGITRHWQPIAIILDIDSAHDPYQLREFKGTLPYVAPEMVPWYEFRKRKKTTQVCQNPIATEKLAMCFRSGSVSSTYS